ncbi:hypothetical protein LUZ63_012485 [Rhynchospora breviuscula]|uniref:Uncharacterized protein n=1 Tax=Rhynchospora breviuscula TaxID=2022672 RepID=A0A9Q0HRK4_9POAL|nr:hypothetical protein LUZ63_012485 [Rhynchospora breviuscula]
MGGICSKGSPVDKSPSEATLDLNLLRDQDTVSSKAQLKTNSAFQHGHELTEKKNNMALTNQSMPPGGPAEPQAPRGSLQKSKSARLRGTAKVSEMGLILGRAGTVGLGKAVEVLDTLGSSMTSLNLSSGFVSGVTAKGNKISILAFEVANTIVKGSNLMQSLSKESVRYLKENVLPSEGVQNLISKDADELLRLAASDKREELKVFSKEVVRFGNRCKDPQWHSLDRYFQKMASELTPQNHLKEEAESIMRELMASVQCTAELYHELHALDRFDQDYRRKNQDDESSTPATTGDSLQILKQELKSQKKHVNGLKKRSLWSKNLEEVMEKFVDVVHFLHLEIHYAFGSADTLDQAEVYDTNRRTRLGPAGLALHYANIICQIDTLVSRSSSVPPSTRDALYQGLPPGIKSALRSRLQTFEIKEELTVAQIKSEMEKTLRWLVPIANNTTRAHHGFGWVGEWANTGMEVNQRATGQTNPTRLETLYHADKEKTESYILDLVVYLHHLISLSKSANGGLRSPIKSPMRSPNQKTIAISRRKNNSSNSVLTEEDQDMLREVKYRKFIPGISKSQEFGIVRSSQLSKYDRLSKSNNHSPTSGTTRESIALPVINFELDRGKALDMIDGVDDVRRI